jgi:AcrR family transcriptional regulator
LLEIVEEQSVSPEAKRIKGDAAERAEARDRLRAELLHAARALADETGGFDGLTVRSVADRVGYRAPIVYQYFAGKRALLLGLVDVGFTELADVLRRAQCAAASERDGDLLLDGAIAYWEFAARNPHLYRLMHTLPAVPFGTAEAPAAARDCFGVLKAIVALGAPDHPAARFDDDAPADLLWAHLHGLVSLTLDGRIKGGAQRARELLTHLTASFAAPALDG